MSILQPQQEIFKPEEYFWCHEGNEHVANWVANNNQDHPHLHATYMNDANMATQRKRNGNLKTLDEHMLAFLEEYPMTSASVIEELAWYKVNILKPGQIGLINVYHHGDDPQIVAQARDLLYKQVFDYATRHNHWVQRGEHDLLNPNEVELVSKKQKNHMRSQARWAKMDERRAAKEAAGPTGELGRILSGLQVAGQEEHQGKTDDDVEMEGRGACSSQSSGMQCSFQHIENERQPVFQKILTPAAEGFTPDPIHG